MRVAMVGPFGLKPKGTMAVRALPLARALVRRGHRVILILPPWSYPADAGRVWTDQGVRIENVPVTPRASIPLHLLSRIRRFQPDIVHVFKPKAYSGIVQWLLWQLRRAGLGRTRIVLDEDDWEGAGGWNDLERYPGVYKRFFDWQEKWGLAHADSVTVASRGLETLVWGLGVPPARVLYLPNGVNHLPPSAHTRAEIRAELGVGDAPTLLLYTRFFEFDLARLARVLTQVFEHAPSARLLVVGKGLFGEEIRFLELARAGGWGERIVSKGWAEPTELRGLLEAADVALYPFDDTLVNRTKAIVKLMDLLAAGVPVVAEAVGQIREYIQNNETGILVSPGDEAGIARNLLDLLNDPPRRAALGECAAATISREYDWTRLSERVESVYLTNQVPSPYQGKG